MDLTDKAPETEMDIDHRTSLFIEHLSHSSGESDRGLVLMLAAQIELYLHDALEAFLVQDKSVTEMFEGPYAPLGTLSAKTKAAFALALITREEADRIDGIRKVRNIFAHQLDASFENAEVKKQCSKPPIANGILCDRDAFFHLGVNTAIPLLYRKIIVKRDWRRTELKKQDIPDL